MPTRKRKIEVYRLTISGLPDGTSYGSLLRNLRGRRPVAKMVMKAGEKSHALNDSTLHNNRLRLRFLSYTKGHRPDILDTNEFSLRENPLTPSQTNVEWTHVLGGSKANRYLLLVERNISGIWPSSLGRYLQWMIDEFYQPPSEGQNGDNPPVVVSLDAEPGQAFIDRIAALDRVTEASVRVVRPNPGWRDLQSELGETAQDSDARRAELTMFARRHASLRRDGGILGWIRKAFHQHELGFAAIKGWKGRQTERFTTEKLGKHASLDIELDDRGQILPVDAWMELSRMMDNLD